MSNSLLYEKVRKAWHPQRWRDFTVLVAVSGGADSVCLMRVMHQLKSQHAGRGQLMVAHVNHALRGEASDADASFVSQLAEQLAVPVIVADGRMLSGLGNQGIGLESALRKKRYDLFAEMAAKYGARYLVTGHTRNDQVETVLFRALRGTGLEGLAGIPVQRSVSANLTIVRPLLTVDRQEVLEYLTQQQQVYREDASNAELQFTRNRIRNVILPQMRECFENSVDEALLRLAEHAENHKAMLRQLMEPLLEQCFLVHPGKVTISCVGLQGQPAELVKAALRAVWRKAGFAEGDMTTAKWNQLTDRLLAASTMPATHVETYPGPVRASIAKETVTLVSLGGKEAV